MCHATVPLYSFLPLFIHLQASESGVRVPWPPFKSGASLLSYFVTRKPFSVQQLPGNCQGSYRHSTRVQVKIIMEDDGSRYVWAHHRHSSAFSFPDRQQWWQQHILGWAKNKNCYEHLAQRYEHEHEQDKIRIHDFLQLRTMFMLPNYNRVLW